jgi:hypothetical protein
MRASNIISSKMNQSRPATRLRAHSYLETVAWSIDLAGWKFYNAAGGDYQCALLHSPISGLLGERPTDTVG